MCECVREAAGGGGEGARDTESKTRTPHKVVGKKCLLESGWPCLGPKRPRLALELPSEAGDAHCAFGRLPSEEVVLQAIRRGGKCDAGIIWARQEMSQTASGC